MKNSGPELISPDELLHLLHTESPRDLLILDLRVFGQYAKSRIQGALNLCIPTTLLKRPAYNIKKLGDTLASRKADKAKFESWTQVKKIIVYDAASWTLDQAASCAHIIQKFVNERWPGAGYVLKGGFNAFAEKHSGELDRGSVEEEKKDDSRGGNLSIDPQGGLPIIGGCAIPAENDVKPFFSTIRQNMDLIDGVGQFPLRRPAGMSGAQMEKMPIWLKRASEPDDEGKVVSERFLAIEKAEQKRMQQALSSAAFENRREQSSHHFRMAGIEKGAKNRYKDILPFEDTRVKLKERNPENCDYVNASHVKPTTTDLHYIACQAPVPSTFQDFWRVIWEQSARTIVMLTAESEEGHLKAHPYWATGSYGPFKVNLTGQEDQPLNYGPDSTPQRTFSNPMSKPFSKMQQPPLNRRHTSNNSAAPLGHASLTKSKTLPNTETPHVTIRRLQLSNTQSSGQRPRPIIQIQLASWPDTGATAHPKDILALVDLCDYFDQPAVTSASTSTGQSSQDASSTRPLVVHCSAGCGRTGSFCTVANVKHMLKTQLMHRKAPSHSFSGDSNVMEHDGMMEVDGEEWKRNEEVDLIAQTVGEFRLHRMSMVQTLRQFVLCYEAVMELFVHDDWLKDAQPPSEKRDQRQRWQDEGMNVDGREPANFPKASSSRRPALGKRALSGI